MLRFIFAALSACALVLLPLAAFADGITVTPQNVRIDDDFVKLVYKVTNETSRYVSAVDFKCLIFDKAGEILAVDQDTASKLAPRQIDYIKSTVSPEGNISSGVGKVECRVLEVE